MDTSTANPSYIKSQELSLAIQSVRHFTLDLVNVLSSLMLSSKLLINSLSPASKISLQVCSILALVDERNEPGSIGEEIVHLLQRELLGLGDESPDAKSIGEVANDEEKVILPANSTHRNTSDLTDHGVEGE